MKVRDLQAILEQCGPETEIDLILNASMVGRRQPLDEDDSVEIGLEPVFSVTWDSSECTGPATRLHIEMPKMSDEVEVESETFDGIPVNPRLPPAFDDTPNDARPQSQIDKWWGSPFIVTATWDDFEDTYADYLERMKGFTDDIESEEAFNARQEERRVTWFKSWPSGTRYDVRCLDGGAWDRSTCWGMVGSLEEAAEVARTGPAWRQRLAEGESE